MAQEVRSLNNRVLEFLQKPAAVAGLVGHMVSPPPPDASEQQQMRLPFAACEVGPLFRPLHTSTGLETTSR